MSEHLNQAQFYYHGTRHPFNEGEHITPAGAAQFPNYAETDSEYVHVSTDPGHAHKFAGISDRFQAERRGHEMGLGPKANYSPKVYRVAPLGQVEPDEDAGLDFEGAEETSFRSQHGFRVLGRQF